MEPGPDSIELNLIHPDGIGMGFYLGLTMILSEPKVSEAKTGFPFRGHGLIRCTNATAGGRKSPARCP
jgi:hypothetical protein